MSLGIHKWVAWSDCILSIFSNEIRLIISYAFLTDSSHEMSSLIFLGRRLFNRLSPLDQYRQPRWLSWMRRPTEDQEVAGSIPAEVGNILSWRLIMKYFLWSFSPFRWFKKSSCRGFNPRRGRQHSFVEIDHEIFSPFRWFKKSSCQFLAKECAQYWLTA